jgi:hypothetical protein
VFVPEGHTGLQRANRQHRFEALDYQTLCALANACTALEALGLAANFDGRKIC